MRRKRINYANSPDSFLYKIINKIFSEYSSISSILLKIGKQLFFLLVFKNFLENNLKLFIIRFAKSEMLIYTINENWPILGQILRLKIFKRSWGWRALTSCWTAIPRLPRNKFLLCNPRALPGGKGDISAETENLL